MSVSFFESLKNYVGFTTESSAALRELHPVAQPFFAPIVEDFYDAIEAHPGARNAITGGSVQIERLKQTLVRWLDKMLLGPHDEAYYQLRARIGRIHVRIALPQQYMFTAMDRREMKPSSSKSRTTGQALPRICLFLTPSSRPRIRAPGWVCRSSTASSVTTEVRSTFSRGPAALASP